MEEITIFDKIVEKKIPANIVYEDETVQEISLLIDDSVLLLKILTLKLQFMLF